MGVTKQTIEAGNGQDYPKKGDNVAIHYTGWLHDPSRPDNKGKEYVALLSLGEITG
jgi:FKBP-type peptidyl-prolyl cis-trans isomerase